jgi:hypothetical protein
VRLRCVILVVGAALVWTGTATAAADRVIVYPQVAGLQVALAAKRLYAGPVDALPGPMTASAIRSLQRQQGLPVTGTLTAATQKALGRLGRPYFGQRVIKRGMVGWDVAVLQFLLATYGFDVGTLDGRFGPQTQAALIAYQERRQLVPDGISGPATHARLCPTAACKSLPRPRARSTAGMPATAIEAAWPAENTPASVVKLRVERWAARAGVPERLALAVAWIESGYQSDIRSRTGDWGPMQVSPPAWDFVESVVLRRPVPHTTNGNVRVGVLYLRHLLREFRGDSRLAVAAYHQGVASVRRVGVLPETEKYVDAVEAVSLRDV